MKNNGNDGRYSRKKPGKTTDEKEIFMDSRLISWYNTKMCFDI